MSQTNQGQTTQKKKSFLNALSQIFWVLRWPGTYANKSGSSHMPCVLKQSGTRKSTAGLLCIASLHISCVLKWLGTCLRFDRTSSTALIHAFCVLKCLVIFLIQRGTFLREIFYLYPSAQARIKFYGQAMIFVSDNPKNNYLLLPLPFLVF